MNILTYQLGPLSTNCYLVFDEESKEAVIIDPADSGDFLTQKINDLKLKLKFILATHGHFDHVLASLELKLNFKVPFLMSKNDQFFLPKARARSKFYTDIDPGINPAKPDKFLKENDVIKLGNEGLTVIDTPGHTPGSICFYKSGSDLDEERSDPSLLFSGDTIFKEAVGRTDLPYSSSSQLESSIKKLLKLPDKTIVYPGHGQKTTILEFKQWKKY